MLKHLRARTAVAGAVFCIGGTVCVAHGFISPQAVSCQEKTPTPLTLSKEDLVKRAHKGEAKFQEKKLIRHATLMHALDISIKKLEYGYREYCHTFSFGQYSLLDDNIREKMIEILRRKLPVLLPGVDFIIRDKTKKQPLYHPTNAFEEDVDVELSW